MNRLPWILVALLGVVSLFALANASAGTAAESVEHDALDRLAVVWASGDPEVAHRVCLMYTHAAKRAGWADEVTLIVWGPSSRLLAADKDVQAKVKQMMQDGVRVEACIACANSYGITDAIRALGIEVKPMGEPLTDMLNSGYKVLSF
ncbi:MAG: DsrE family protein [Phycisphaerales bacterium]